MNDSMILPALFDALDQASQRLVADMVSRHTYPAGAIIHHQGDTCDRLEWIGRGSVNIEQLDPDGSKRLWHIERPGRLLALPVALATEPIYKMTVATSEDTILNALPLDRVHDLIWNHPAFAWALLQTLADSALGRIEQVKRTMHVPLRERLLDWLEQQSIQQGRRTMVLPVSKTLLAEQMGVARTSLSRMFQQLRDDGILTFHRNKVTLMQESGRNDGGTTHSGI
jgi:CRP-like cAMP-binding protein